MGNIVTVSVNSEWLMGNWDITLTQEERLSNYLLMIAEL